jgi:enoyl-CoA hydratase/carnithine racemase
VSGALAVGTVYAEIHQDVGWLTISNPGKLNALSVAMMDLLGEFLRQLHDDPAVRVVVLRGDAGGKAFAAGADISEFEAQHTQADARRAADDAVTRLFGALSALDRPVIAMIGGHCLGAGLALALAADIRIATDTSTFAIPAARLGIGYPTPLTRALAATAGPGAAAEILFTGRTLTASEALAMGLINHQVGATDLERDVRSLAATIAANAPLSIRAAKAAIRSSIEPALTPHADSLVAACVNSDDAREGQRAFMQKRAPRFRGV